MSVVEGMMTEDQSGIRENPIPGNSFTIEDSEDKETLKNVAVAAEVTQSTYLQPHKSDGKDDTKQSNKSINDDASTSLADDEQPQRKKLKSSENSSTIEDAEDKGTLKNVASAAEVTQSTYLQPHKSDGKDDTKQPNKSSIDDDASTSLADDEQPQRKELKSTAGINEEFKIPKDVLPALDSMQQKATTSGMSKCLPKEVTTDKKEAYSHCWVCHLKVLKQDKNFECAKCHRFFHVRCAKYKYGAINGKICPACTAHTVDGSGKALAISPRDLQRSLNIAIIQKWEELRIISEYEEYSTSEIPNPVDLTYLLKKINSTKGYKNTSKFLEDAKWIYHRCFIIYGAKNEITKKSKALITYLTAEVIKIEACPDCYRDVYDKQTTCTAIHTLIWAKVKGYPYWPAKVLKVIKDEVHVLFFGTQERATLSLKTRPPAMYLLSEDNPSKKIPNNLKYDYQEGLEELQTHINALIIKTGTFRYAPQKIRYRGPYYVSTETSSNSSIVQPEETKPEEVKLAQPPKRVEGEHESVPRCINDEDVPEVSSDSNAVVLSASGAAAKSDMNPDNISLEKFEDKAEMSMP